MVHRILLFFTIFSFAASLLGGGAQARVEWEVLKTIKAEGVPIDTAVSADGSSFYILTDDGKVQILSVQGEVKGTVDVGKDAKFIEVSPQGDLLFVTDQTKKNVQLISLDFVVQLTVAGSPIEGPKDASVNITVFSDFQ